MKKELTVGIFLMVGIIGFALTVLLLKDVNFEKGYRLNVYFDDVGNLMEKAWVRMRGVRIGKIEKIDIQGERARVVVWIKSDVKIYKGSKAKISSTGVLGVKYLEIVLNKNSQEILKDGDSIYNSESIVSIDDALSEGITSIKKFSDFLENLSENKDMVVDLKEIFNNFQEISRKLNDSIEVQKIKNIVKYLETAGKDINEVIQPNKESVSLAMLSIKNLSQKIDTLVDNISSTETVIGQLTQDKTTGKKISETLDSLKLATEQANKTLNRINLFMTYWDYRLRYDTANNEFKNDIAIEIFPRNNKFYYLGATNVSSEKTTSENNNTFSIGIGGNFYNYLTVYGGIIRSFGGAGLKFFPFGYKSKLIEFGTEIYDFSKNKNSPNIDLSLKVQLLKWLYLGTRYEDLANNRLFNTTFNLTFKDEDIAYLLGLVGLAR